MTGNKELVQGIFAIVGLMRPRLNIAEGGCTTSNPRGPKINSRIKELSPHKITVFLALQYQMGAT
ncbi:MAG TPA: hypothetical protein VEG25_06970 [Burkholderiales bacterium]|nr:hypothetical protein [Burkholderiales bacterium]